MHSVQTCTRPTVHVRLLRLCLTTRNTFWVTYFRHKLLFMSSAFALSLKTVQNKPQQKGKTNWLNKQVNVSRIKKRSLAVTFWCNYVTCKKFKLNEPKFYTSTSHCVICIWTAAHFINHIPLSEVNYQQLFTNVSREKMPALLFYSCFGTLLLPKLNTHSMTLASVCQMDSEKYEECKLLTETMQCLWR